MSCEDIVCYPMNINYEEYATQYNNWLLCKNLTRMSSED